MRKPHTGILLLICLSLTACIGTQVEYTPGSRFEPASHTQYAWVTEPVADNGRQDSFYLLDHYLRKAIDSGLNKRGYRKVEKTEAEFLVEYRFFNDVTVDQGGVISPRDHALASMETGGDINNTRIHNHYIPAEIKRANLELLLTDTSGEQLWQVRARKIMEGDMQNPKHVEKGVNGVVPKMLRHLPAR